MLEEKEEEGMGTATILYGETDAFIQHVKTQLWLSYQVLCFMSELPIFLLSLRKKRNRREGMA